ncbi:MAG: glycosyltransferase family 4 protein [Clostridiales bacterium]|nr:glycosyltransferase family 4 protein [Clostridiales bacterium]
MKIAMIGHKRIPSREGGIEIVVERLAAGLAEMGFEVVAYNRSGSHVSGSRFGNDNMCLKGIKLVTVPTPQNKKLNAAVYSALATLKALFGKFDVVHFHAEGPAAMCFLTKLFKIRTIVTIHGLDWKNPKWKGFAEKYLKIGEKTAAKYADEVIVLSKSMQNYFLETYGRKTVYIPNGVDNPEIKNCRIIKDKYGLEKNKYFLYLGRIVQGKGLDYLIEAYSDLKTDFPLVIAGGASHSYEYFSSLKEKAAGKNIIFTDFVQGGELNELYSNCFAYVFPSDSEGMPLSLLEAMSYGNCCLTSDIPECTEVCGDYAVYFKKGNSQDLKNKMQTLLDNPEIRENLKNNSASYILEKYSWKDTVNKTAALYRGDSDD